MTFNGKNAYAVTDNQNVICYKRNVRLMLGLLTCLLYGMYCAIQDSVMTLDLWVLVVGLSK